MATKAGVWIDHKQAVVVLITDSGKEIRKFASGPEPAGPAGSPGSKNQYSPNDFIAEDRRERKLMAERKKVYADVLAYIRGADSLLILGPGEAKGEFKKHILAKKRAGLTIEVETTDKMTDRQLAAKVSGHFSISSASKSSAPRKTTKAVPVKSAKKTKK